jgi:hypothetical protein
MIRTVNCLCCLDLALILVGEVGRGQGGDSVEGGESDFADLARGAVGGRLGVGRESILGVALSALVIIVQVQLDHLPQRVGLALFEQAVEVHEEDEPADKARRGEGE